MCIGPRTVTHTRLHVKTHKCRVPSELLRRTGHEVVGGACLAGLCYNVCCARTLDGGEGLEDCGDVLLYRRRREVLLEETEKGAEDDGVFDGHGGALTKIWESWVSCIAHERSEASSPRGQLWKLQQREAHELRCRVEYLPHGRVPSRHPLPHMAQGITALTAGVEVGIRYCNNEVEHRAAADGVKDGVGAGAEPQAALPGGGDVAERGRGELRRGEEDAVGKGTGA